MADPFDDQRFGRQAGNRYLCQLGSLRDPDLTKGDALGRGLLNDASGQLNPFKLEELFHRSLINAFGGVSNWEDMPFFEKERAINRVLEKACHIVGIPTIRATSAVTRGDTPNHAEYAPGSWMIRLSRPIFMNRDERLVENQKALDFIENYVGSDEQEKYKANLANLYRTETLSRQDVIGTLVHECQHALQEFISLCLIAGDGFTGDLQPLAPENDLSPPDYGVEIGGETYMSRPNVWNVAKQHPTQHPYARALTEAVEQDRGHLTLRSSSNVDKATKEALHLSHYNPRIGQLSLENNAAWAQWQAERDVYDTAWFRKISQDARPSPTQPRTHLHQAQHRDDVEAWMPAQCVANPVSRK